MRANPSMDATAVPPVSPLMLSDRLLRLAEYADSAGLRLTAEHLLAMAEDVLDPPTPLHA